MRRYILFLYFIVLPLIGATAQELAFDPVQGYLAAAGNLAAIYHGKEQLKYSRALLKHPYLGSEAYEVGDVSFEQILYKNVKLRLDLYRSELMVLSLDDRFNIILPANRVDYAHFRGYHIFYHYPDETKGCPPEGYYLRLHDGALKVLERQGCTLDRSTKDMKIEETFVRYVRYYIHKDGVYYTVKSKGTLLKALRDRKSELTHFIRQKGLDFKKAPEQTLVEVVKEYERLNDQP